MCPWSCGSMINNTGAVNQTQWHSPVPYLLGGLAAMLALIALALLVLVCSFWKMAGYLEAPNAASASAESAKTDMDLATSPEEKNVVVIMAGDDKPTFIAKPCSASETI